MGKLISVKSTPGLPLRYDHAMLDMMTMLQVWLWHSLLLRTKVLGAMQYSGTV